MHWHNTYRYISNNRLQKKNILQKNIYIRDNYNILAYLSTSIIATPALGTQMFLLLIYNNFSYFEMKVLIKIRLYKLQTYNFHKITHTHHKHFHNKQSIIMKKKRSHMQTSENCKPQL